MLALSSVPAVVQFMGFIFLPESPRWLLQKGRTQEARDVLSRIRGGQSVDAEYETIKTSIEEEEREAGGGERSHQQRQTPGVLSILVPSRPFRRSGHSEGPPSRPDSQGAGCRLRSADVPAAERDKHSHVCHPRSSPPGSGSLTLALTPLLTWSSFFRYYSATILQMAGVRDDRQAIWLTAATSGSNFVFTLLGVWLVDRLGRRKLTLGSLLGTPAVT